MSERKPPEPGHQFQGETENEELFHQDSELRQCQLPRESNICYKAIEAH
jgi:hypothetical protein